MRLKAEAILEFGDADEQPNGVVREYRDEYKLLSEILDKQPRILELVHHDLQQLSNSTSRCGRKADFTSENRFRAILVMQREGLDYREASIRIAEVKRSSVSAVFSRSRRSILRCSARRLARCRRRPGKRSTIC